MTVQELHILFDNLHCEFIGRHCGKLTDCVSKRLSYFLSITPMWSAVNYESFIAYHLKKIRQRGHGGIVNSLNLFSKKKLIEWTEDTRVVKQLGYAKNEFLSPIVIEESYFEEQRQKYFNTIRGFLHCDSFGNLYDTTSECCKKCKYIDKCKKN